MRDTIINPTGVNSCWIETFINYDKSLTCEDFFSIVVNNTFIYTNNNPPTALHVVIKYQNKLTFELNIQRGIW